MPQCLFIAPVKVVHSFPQTLYKKSSNTAARKCNENAKKCHVT